MGKPTATPIPHTFPLVQHRIFQASPARTVLLVALWVSCGVFFSSARAAEARGLPFIRAYSLDEIGKVPRSARLGFDSFGRFAVMYDGTYVALNDTAWVERLSSQSPNRSLMTTVRAEGGVYYYGGRASWGIAAPAADGTLEARPLVPADAPAWTKVTAFNEILISGTGIYFHEINGVVYWDFETRKNHFFELPRVAACFRVGDRVFVSCEDGHLREILPASGSIRIISVPGLEMSVVDQVASLDPSRALLALRDGRMLTFNGQEAAVWPPQRTLQLQGRVLALTPLSEGGVAVSIAQKGLFLFSADDSLRWRLPSTDFQLVTALAANEPGVLWAMGENAVFKVFYSSPLTSFGNSLGLTPAWPTIVAWGDQHVVCSGRTLYKLAGTELAAPSRFTPLAGLPEGSITSVAARGPHLLAADTAGVLTITGDGGIERIAELHNPARLVFIAPDVCVVIGSREIAALRYLNGRWSDCAPRIAGVGDAPVRTLMRGSLWLEMGGDKVARLTLRDGRLDLHRVQVPWPGGTWTNLGAVGPLIVISGAVGNRAFFNEDTGEFCDAPALAELLNRSPYWIARVIEDKNGILWATHTRGVVTFTPENDDYRVDSSSFELRNDSYPEVSLLPSDTIWITSGRSLYHVERQREVAPRRPELRLVSMTADQEQREMLARHEGKRDGLRFSYDDNNLSFRFFSGTYAWRSPPLYQYRLSTHEPWTPVDSSLVLRFPKLREGDYRLEVRQSEPHADNEESFAVAFAIAPPWYRTPVGYAGGALLVLAVSTGVARWMNQRSRRRNEELEKLVQVRTSELAKTMERLHEETRNAATLAERSRLAGEIHDSLQQGLSGTLLHLDTTLTHSALTPELRAQLGVMRNMLSYSREEVQQAVWNLESPLLQNSTLNEALQKLIGFINAGTVSLKVTVPAEPVLLAPEVQHHLLRVAQEGITNAVKHARASHIGVTLQAENDVVTLSVTDDGCGFDVDAGSRAEAHFGLRGIRARAHSIRAELQIASAPGAGTTIHLSVTTPPQRYERLCQD